MLGLPVPERASKAPRYRQIEAALQEAIRSGVFSAGDKIPSIRALAREFSVSKPTVECALRFLAANGYVIAHDRSGYRVTDLPSEQGEAVAPEISRKRPLRFDFRENAADPELFPIEAWRRSVFRASRDRSLLTQYGNPQGEERLRQALSRYLKESRGVHADPDSIVVGAGILSFVRLLHRLLGAQDRRMLLEGSGFPILEKALADYGWQTRRFTFSEILQQDAAVLYLGSEIEGGKRRLTAAERLSVLHYLSRRKAWLLEDDYTGEFRSNSEASASLQSMNPNARIFYFGSFSRLLTPSLRVSFLVVPHLARCALKEYLIQTTPTASTLEQLALADFMERGELRRHIRALKVQSARKVESFRSFLSERLSPDFELKEAASRTALLITSPSGWQQDLERFAQEEGLSFRTFPSGELLVSPISVAERDLETAAEVLAEFLIRNKLS